jgi:Tfp pilus assembly protein PilF
MKRVWATFCAGLLCVLWITAPARANGVSEADAGARALKNGDLESAIQYFTLAIQSQDLAEDELAITYHHRGIAYQRGGDTARAVLDYTAALQKGGLPGELRPRAYNNRSICFEILGDLDSALRDLNQAIKANPEYPEPYANRAGILSKKKEYDLAIRDYQNAIALLHPRPTQSLLGIGLALQAKGLLNQASSYYRRALALDPSLATAREKLAEIQRASIGAPVGLSLEFPKDVVAEMSSAPNGEKGAVLRATVTEGNSAPVTSAGFVAPRVQLKDIPMRQTPQSNGRSGVMSKGPKGGPEQALPDRAQSRPQFSGLLANTLAPKSASQNTEVASDGDFAVQLGSFNSQELAEQSWSQLQQRIGDALSGLRASIVAADISGKGRVYRLIAMGLASREAAIAACARLKVLGQPCILAAR